MSTLKTDVLKDVAETVSVDVVDLLGAVNLRQDLADELDLAKGSGLVGFSSALSYPSATVGGAVNSLVADGVVELQSLRQDSNLKCDVRGFYTGSIIGGGEFYWSATEPKVNHNGWRIIDPDIAWDGTSATLPTYLSAVGGVGNGCFIRVFNGTASPEMAGAVTDWNGTTGTVAKPSLDALIEDVNVTKITGSGETYWFGSIAANAILFTITRDIVIDWGGSLLVCSSDNTIAGTDAALFKFLDCRMNMRNYVFDDIAFLIAGISRGAMPALLVADLETTYGHTLGPFHVIRGQSLITSASVNPNTARSIDVKLVGGCSGDIVYYGVNLANNGDSFSGKYSLNEVNRAIFVYGVDGVDATFKVKEGQPASANVLISASGTGMPATKNVKVRGHFDLIDGPFVIADQPVADGTGVYQNIDLDLSFDALGGNITVANPIARIGAYDLGGALFTVEKTIRTDNVKLAIRPGPSVALLDNPIQVFTPSPNHGLLTLEPGAAYAPSSLSPKNASNVPMGPTVFTNGRYMKAAHGDLTAAGNRAIIPTEFLAPNDKNQEVIANLRVTLRNTVGGSNEYTYKEFTVIGTLSSTGVLTLHKATQIQSDINGAGVPVVTVAAAAAGAGLEVSATVYTGAFASLVASVSWA